MANGKSSVITFNISETPSEEDKEIPIVFSGTSCIFVPAGAILVDFRFLGAESFGSARILYFYQPSDLL
jgi:hypothetical protein